MEKWLITRFWILKITFSLNDANEEYDIMVVVKWKIFVVACLALPLAFAAAQELQPATSGDTSENKSKIIYVLLECCYFNYRPYCNSMVLSGDCTTCVSEGNSRGKKSWKYGFVLLHKIIVLMAICH